MVILGYVLIYWAWILFEVLFVGSRLVYLVYMKRGSLVEIGLPRFYLGFLFSLFGVDGYLVWLVSRGCGP